MPEPETASKVRGPYAKSARIRAEVIEKAIAAFAERGFTGTSMREIALAVGMTQQGLSHHFPSKEALLEAVLAHRDATGVEHHKAAHRSVMGTLRAIVEENSSSPGLVQLSVMLAAEAITPSHPAHEFFQEHWSGAREVFTRLLARGQAEGEVRTDLPAEELAVVLVGLFEGIQLQWLANPAISLTGTFETALRLLAPSDASGSLGPSAS